MEQISLMSEEFQRATRKLLDDPPCPVFPDASLFLYQAFGGLWSILHWMGAPFGIILSPLVAHLSFRAYKVSWARATKSQRMYTMMIGAIAAPIGAIFANPGRFRELLEKADAA